MADGDPRFLSAGDIDDSLNFRDLIETLRTAFRSDVVTPVRHHHAVSRPDGADSTLLLMPAWTDFVAQGHSMLGNIGIKTVTVSPDNPSLGKPSVTGLYLLLSGRTGEPLAILDGQALTLWRTAAASALAADYLARDDAERLVMVGAGALAPFLVDAHAAIRPIRDVAVWNRSHDKAQLLAEKLARPDLRLRAVADLPAALRGADIVSCATMSATPVVSGDWLHPGMHLDLVGAFRPDMRETDDAAIRKSRLFVDTRAGALAEAGDLAMPIADGVITADAIVGELSELCAGTVQGRRTADEITLFKSVGTALEDLAAAQHVFLAQ